MLKPTERPCVSCPQRIHHRLALTKAFCGGRPEAAIANDSTWVPAQQNTAALKSKWHLRQLTHLSLGLQVMPEEPVTARDEKFNLSTSPYIQVRMP